MNFFSSSKRKVYNNLILFWFFVSVKNYEVDLSHRLKTAAHEIGLEICYNFFLYLKQIFLYSLNMYKTITQNSITYYFLFLIVVSNVFQYYLLLFRNISLNSAGEN